MRHSEHPTRTKRRKSWLRRLAVWSASAVLVLLVAIVVAAPWILRSAVPEVFARFGVQASATGGSLRLLRREVTLEGLVVGAPGVPAISLGELGIGLGLRALVEGRIQLRYLRVKNVSMDIEKLVALRELGDSGAGSAAQGMPLELDELDLQDVRLDSVGETIGHDVRITRLSIGNLSALLSGQKSNVDLQGSIRDGSAKLQLEVGFDKGNVRASGNYQIDNLPVRGWAKLATQAIDPLSAGVVSGRGKLNLDYVPGTQNLDLTLDGRMGLAGLGVDIEGLEAERGDADWQGRLALQWAPELANANLRGDGKLDVQTLHLVFTESSPASVGAAISDLSWHGDFHLQNVLTSKGTVVGTRVDVSDASSPRPAWRVRAEDFSWGLQTNAQGDADAVGARMQDLNLARLSVAVTKPDAAVDIAADKLSIDEVRLAQSGNLVLGLTNVDLLTIAEGGKAGASQDADALNLRVSGLVAKGLSGDFSGKLHVAHLSSESLDYAQSGRQLRAEAIDLASVGFRVPAWLGADELKVKSIRADQGAGDIWVSGLKANKLHGEADGKFGVEALDVGHMFQSDSSTHSWDAANLKLRGVRGVSADSAQVSEVDLGGLRVGTDDATWEGSGLHSSDLAITMTGDVELARLGLTKLERRQASTGDLSTSALEAHGFRLRDTRAGFDGVKAAKLEYKLHGGDAFELRSLQATGLDGDRSKGLEAGRFSVASGAAQLVNGARLRAVAFDAHGVSVASDGGIAASKAQLQNFTRSEGDAEILELERLSSAELRWAPGGQLSMAEAVVHAARLESAKGAGWRLATLDARTLDWDGGQRIRAELVTLASARQGHGPSLDWQAQALRATEFHLLLPADVAVATLTAESVHGGGPPTWKVLALDAREISSTENHGHTVATLESGALTVTDARNGAELIVDRAELEAARLSTLKDLSAERLLVKGLRIHSSSAAWPPRLSVPELRVETPRLGFDGSVDLGAVVADDAYLIVARAKDGSWMWPPLPGGGPGGGDTSAEKNSSSSVIRMQSLSTHGPGRVALIDQVTDPAAHLLLDPFVFAMQGLDTRLPGNVAHFRARGTGPKFVGMRLDGELIRRIGGFNLALRLDFKGIYLPELDPYISRVENFTVTAGRADASNDFKIDNDELTGKVEMLLSGLELETFTGGKVFSKIDPLNFPVRTALRLLKDRQGNISLTIPIRAQTEAPNFEFFDVFRRSFVTTVNAAGTMAASLPGKTLDRSVQLLEGTISLLPGIDTARYPAVEFDYGADGLSAEGFIYLDQLGERLGASNTLVLALCGWSVSKDEVSAIENPTSIDKLLAAAGQGVYPEFPPGRAGLLALAEARAGMVRDYLLSIQKIPKGRILSCDARIDEDAGAKPRVEIQVKTPAEHRGMFGIFF